MEADLTAKSTESAETTESNKDSEKKQVKILPASIGILLLISSSLAMFKGTSLYLDGLASQSYEKLDGIVSEIKQHSEVLGVRKEVILSYEFKGKKFLGSCNYPAGRIMKEGENTVLWCDRANPQKLALSQEIDYDWVIMLGGYGLFVFCFGVLICKKSIFG